MKRTQRNHCQQMAHSQHELSVMVLFSSMVELVFENVVTSVLFVPLHLVLLSLATHFLQRPPSTIGLGLKPLWHSQATLSL